MSNRRVTLGDVARVAAVSAATVSRSLRGDPQISEPTRLRVRQVADELGYVPNVAARGLVLQQTQTLGLMTPDVTDPIHGQVVAEFQRYAMARGFSVIFANGLRDADNERRVLRTFASHYVDGVALMGSVLRQDEVLALLAPSKATFMVSENLRLTSFRLELPRGCIRADDAAGMHAVAEHLVGLGHRSVAFVGTNACATQVIRRDALAAAAAERGLGDVAVHTVKVHEAPDFLAVARRLHDDRPDAAVCYDDKTALSLIDALRTVGMRVPDDVSVAGFDDTPMASIANPRLTTVAQPTAEMARRTAEMLIASISGQPLADSQLLPVALQVRESTRAR
jgi:LacI family transcriptional regulator, galactose operon repressor